MGRNAPSPQIHKVGAHQIRIEIVNLLVRQGAEIIPLMMMAYHNELAERARTCIDDVVRFWPGDPDGFVVAHEFALIRTIETEPSLRRVAEFAAAALQIEQRWLPTALFVRVKRRSKRRNEIKMFLEENTILGQAHQNPHGRDEKVER
jgi:hypothetical protein